MHNEVRLRFREILDEKMPGTQAPDLARALDVSNETAKHYLLDKWTTVDRGVLERFADFVKCESIAEIIEAKPSPFWDAFPESGSNCLYFGPNPKRRSNIAGMLEHNDSTALVAVSSLVKDCAPATRVQDVVEDSEETFIGSNDNCVVVGSPLSNPVCALALGQVFDVESGNGPAPFQFVWNPKLNPPISSFGRTSTESNKKVGIWLRDSDKTVESSQYNPDTAAFKKEYIRNGRDCAIVCVKNRSTVEGVRKLILIAGLTGIGTQAAASKLVEDFRELEPRRLESMVWGVVEVIYQKAHGSLERKIFHCDWRYRSGGRSPIEFKKNPIKRRGGVRVKGANS
jgi:hypothetical protein